MVYPLQAKETRIAKRIRIAIDQKALLFDPFDPDSSLRCYTCTEERQVSRLTATNTRRLLGAILSYDFSARERADLKRLYFNVLPFKTSEA